ncbi:unnamed protein product [Peronospora belbahrii]|uniref:Uncharacterized protein n=1 Tax=Peronospora belbahrii TaxID=622444 RepID=A0ABN8D5G7_9STRA|nr:unnamed protein product [Peronospora belbahrii]
MTLRDTTALSCSPLIFIPLGTPHIAASPRITFIVDRSTTAAKQIRSRWTLHDVPDVVIFKRLDYFQHCLCSNRQHLDRASPQRVF